LQINLIYRVGTVGLVFGQRLRDFQSSCSFGARRLLQNEIFYES